MIATLASNDPLAKLIRNPLDFALAGQKHQHGPILLREGYHDRTHDGGLKPLIGVTPKVSRLHRETAPVAVNNRCVAKHSGNAGPVDRRRHDDNPEIFTQPGLGIKGKRKSKIRIERAFVKLVKQNRADAFQGGIINDHPGEDAFGDNFDACRRPDVSCKTRPHADSLADLFANQIGHTMRSSTRRKTPRLKNENALPCHPTRRQHGQRNNCRLTGTRWCHKHRIRSPGERL